MGLAIFFIYINGLRAICAVGDRAWNECADSNLRQFETGMCGAAMPGNAAPHITETIEKRL